MLKMDLNGLWDFVVDLDPKYHRALEGELPPYARVDWNRRHWEKVSVPGAWNKYAERLDIYEGVCWFAREFFIDDLPDNPVGILRFGAVNYKCRVFLNGQCVGTHEGGFTEFTLDVSQAISPGRNVLVVEVDNRATQIHLPPCLGYFNYGGIHRDVSLEIHSGPWLKDVSLEAAHDGQLRVTGRANQAQCQMMVAVSCGGATTTCHLKEDGSFETILQVPNITPWSPKSPVLYPANVQLLCNQCVLDENSFDIGFRTIEVYGDQILLNGEPIYLKGICYLYDSPVHGVALKPEQYLEDLQLLLELGVNAIRSHFPFTHEFYRACDRAGIMVWIEPPVYCINPKADACGTVFSNPEVIQLACSMMSETILPARNHPCVIMYGVGNECNVDHPEAKAFFEALCNTARQLDPTRLLSYASLYCDVGPLADMVDVLGINAYWGWYERIDAPEEQQRAPIDLKVLDNKLSELTSQHAKPLLMTEFGADSVPGYISASRDLWSEDYHAHLTDRTFDVLDKHPAVRGAFPFCFSDYRDPSKLINGHWDGLNYKGVVSYQRRPKKAFYALKHIYGDKI